MDPWGDVVDVSDRSAGREGLARGNSERILTEAAAGRGSHEAFPGQLGQP